MDNNTISLKEVYENQSSLTLQTKNKQIQLTLNKNCLPIGSADYSVTNESRWITIPNTTNKKKPDTHFNNRNTCLRIRIKSIMKEESKQTQQLQINKANPIGENKQITFKSVKPLMHLPVKLTSDYFTKSNNEKGSKKYTNSKSKNIMNNNCINRFKHNKSCEDDFERNSSTSYLITDIQTKPLRKINKAFFQTNILNSPNHIINKNKSKQKGSTNTHKTWNNYGNLLSKSTHSTLIGATNDSVLSSVTPIKNDQGSQHLTVASNKSITKIQKTFISNQRELVSPQQKNFERDIIDTNYEINLRKDELLSSSQRLTDRVITESDNERDNANDSFDESLLKNDNNDNNNNDNDFNGIKEDIDIFYTIDYIKAIPSETISLEIQLFLDKICDLQQAYHKEISHGQIVNAKYKEILQRYLDKLIQQNKKNYSLKYHKDKMLFLDSLNLSVTNHELKHKSNTILVNKREISFWENLPLSELSSNANKISYDNSSMQTMKSNKLYELFSDITERNKNKMDVIEKKLSEGTIIKHLRTKSMDENKIHNSIAITEKPSISIIPQCPYEKNAESIKSNNSKIINRLNTQNKKKKRKLKSDKCIRSIKPISQMPK